MGRANEVLRKLKDGQRLLSIYDQVWNKVPKPQKSAFVSDTPYYIIGQQYATLLDEAGNKDKAESVRAKLESLVGKAE